MSRILGIDYGERYIGFAISDEKELIASPLFQIDLKKGNFFETLEKIIDEYNPYQIVMGEPLSLSGKRLELSQKIRKKGREIEKKFKIKVIYWDERFTSKLAERHKKENIHAISAAYLLQNYLDFKYNEKRRKGGH